MFLVAAAIGVAAFLLTWLLREVPLRKTTGAGETAGETFEGVSEQCRRRARPVRRPAAARQQASDEVASGRGRVAHQPGSKQARQRAWYESRPPITTVSPLNGRGLAVDEPLRVHRRLAAAVADRLQLRDLVRHREQPRHRAERLRR